MRNVIVTGASRGLGLAMARSLAAGGDRVLVVARSRTEELASLMAERGEAVRFHPYDLMEVDGLHALVRDIRADAGPIYGLVNNAGLGTEGVLATMSQSKIEALIRLNTLSPILLTRSVARHMAAERCGRIVNVSSIAATTGFSGLAVYSATKASLIGFTKSLARELGPAGVTVNAVAPGIIETDMTRHMGDVPLAKVRDRSALRRLAEAQDVAAAVGYLLSEAARNVTGHVLTVDAGATA